MLPRNEYPRPQFERAEWVNLNGEWEYTFDFSGSGDERGLKNSGAFDGRITVPFCPESKLSGVGYTDFIEMMWYRRDLEIPAAWGDKTILLHFGGVDYECVVYIDGKEAGRHTGGSSPFTLDVSRLVRAGARHNLVVRVEDRVRSGLQPAGKQSQQFIHQGCFYTRTTGIWQPVWMEAVSPWALKSCRIVPDWDNGSFTFFPVLLKVKRGLRLAVSIRDGGTEVASRTVGAGCGALTLQLPEPREWNPESPFLYDIVFRLYDDRGALLDEVRSYAGLRKIHLEDGRCYLNDKPVFLRLVLDQGYYEDGIWTAPSDEALRHDIELSMRSGFNGARLHQKVFDERFHYWADRMGYLTWAEFPDWGINFWQHCQKTDPDYCRAFRNYMAEWGAVVERDLNHPSIIAWTPLNETSHCYDAEEHRRFLADVYDLTRRLDPTRPVNESSGYCHARTDLWTVHLYQQSAAELAEKVNTLPVFMKDPALEAPAWNGQPYLVDEYGGVCYLPEGKRPFAANTWGYNKDSLSCEEAERRIAELTACLVENPRIAGYCYTQLTDVEQEQNGIYNYDRSEKFDMEKIRACFLQRPGWSRY